MSSTPNPSQEKSESTIGAVLTLARTQKGLPLEKAAHDTRIRTQRLREIESDDFSQFSHPNYARLFMMDYAKYLGVPVASIRGLLPERGECGAEGYQYLQDNPSEAVLTPMRLAPRRRRLMPVLGGAVAVLLLAFLGLQILIFKNKFDRINSTSPAIPSQVNEDKALLESENSNAPAATAETTAQAPATEQAALFVGGAPTHKTDSL